MVVWCVWVCFIFFKNPTRTNQLRKKEIQTYRVEHNICAWRWAQTFSVVTKFYLKTGHLSNEQVIAFFYGRYKIECLEERILVFMVYMFIKPLSKEKKERQCRFDFLILCLLALTVVPLYHFVLTENEDVSIKCRKSRCNTFKDESQ